MPSVKYPLGMFSVVVTFDLMPGTVFPAVPNLLYLLGMLAARRPQFSDCPYKISLLSIIIFNYVFKVANMDCLMDYFGFLNLTIRSDSTL